MKPPHRRTFIAAGAAATLIPAVGCASTQITDGPPSASISAPIAVVSGVNEPFRGRNEQAVAGPGLPPPILIPFGYVEEEFFVSGLVNGQPYSTSLLVRKPSEPVRFSGHVAVETLHQAGAIPYWGAGRSVWMQGGHGWALVSSQRLALENQTKTANPSRYAALAIPDAGEAQDRVSQAIMTQVGALLKSNARNGPFQGMNVRFLTMGGASQTGSTTLRYIQQSHADARLRNGQPIYDGYAPMLWLTNEPLPFTASPIMHLVTENEVMRNTASAVRADGDAPDNRHRHYQLTAAAHVTTRGMRDPTSIGPTMQNVVRPGEQLNQFPTAQYFTALVTHFVDWVMHGAAPPSAAPIQLANGEIVRDEFGNALGGIRSPYVDLPTARYIASAPRSEGDSNARGQIGLQEPLPQATLLRLYGTRENYLRRFNEQIDQAISDRWLLPAGAQQLKEEEARYPPL